MIFSILTGGGIMATKSILKDIEIKDKKLGKDFAKALDVTVEKAEKGFECEPLKRTCRKLSGEEINKFLNI